jgi:hypothetical protein
MYNLIGAKVIIRLEKDFLCSFTASQVAIFNFFGFTKTTYSLIIGYSTLLRIF